MITLHEPELAKYPKVGTCSGLFMCNFSMALGDSNVSETTTLLAADEEQQSFGASLRRRSSAYLPPYCENQLPAAEAPAVSSLTVWTTVPVSLLGVFVANLDSSILVASSQQIASEFNCLSQASWLVTSFVLAQCASQPLYGKLSDIFGRRSNLTVAYTFFAAGCFLCGVGQSYWHVLAGRAISGIGGAGMTALVSIIIADVVPVRQIASWRSYVNIVATTGRALGGPLGGWICNLLGWRWCFYGQVPPTILGLFLILWGLPSKPFSIETDDEDENESFSKNLARVDVAGAVTLAATISIFLLILHFANEDLSQTTILILVALFVVSGLMFYLIERRWAKEPILPLELLTNRATLSSCLLSGFQMVAQYSLFYSTPLYFQIVSGSNVGDAGLRLVPAVVGNATAGLLSGYVISKTGKYKLLTILANIAGFIGYLLVLLRWRGEVSWAETLYIGLGGFASGTNQSTGFVHVAASLDPNMIAIAGTTLYLSHNLFLLVGLQLATAVLHARLKASLETGLQGIKHKKQIIESAVSSVEAVRKLPPFIRDIVVQAYIDGLSNTFAISVIFAVFAVTVGFTLRERKL